MSEEKQDKFETVDLPLILLALKKAKEEKSPGVVTVHFSDNGGVISITRESKEKIK